MFWHDIRARTANDEDISPPKPPVCVNRRSLRAISPMALIIVLNGKIVGFRPSRVVLDRDRRCPC